MSSREHVSGFVKPVGEIQIVAHLSDNRFRSQLDGYSSSVSGDLVDENVVVTKFEIVMGGKAAVSSEYLFSIQEVVPVGAIWGR